MFVFTTGRTFIQSINNVVVFIQIFYAVDVYNECIDNNMSCSDIQQKKVM